MASYDETVTSTANAAPTAPFVTVVMYAEVVTAAPSVILGFTKTYTEAGASTSTVTPYAFASLVSGATATTTATPSTAVTKTLSSLSNGVSTTIAAYTNTALSASNGTSAVDGIVVNLLRSAANAISTATPGNTPTLLLVATGDASSSVIRGLVETALSASAATSTVTPVRSLNLTSTSTGASTGSVASASSAVSFVNALESSGYASSTTVMQVARTVYAQSLGSSNSSALFRDPNDIAWVMNTETAALSQYNNFAFNSLAYVDGKVYAACLDGIYVLEGNDDEGAHIRAEAVSGFDDLGEQHTKHAGSLYFGYTSDGPVVVDVETYGSGHAKQTYEIEQRTALAPRNNRVKLGKGLSSRHWRITVKNKDGSRFELNDAAIDVAVSQRRI